jgi:tetratricopeptide (TPR) repeat protein
MTGRRWAALAVGVATLLGPPGQGPAGAAERPGLRPLPAPPLEGTEEAVHQELDRYRESVARDLAEEAVDPARLAAGFARLGQLYLLYDFDQAARDCFWNARALDPADARWSYYLGVAHERLGDHREAAAAYTQVLSARPHDEATLIRAARLALEGGELERAEEAFRQALQQHPDSAAARHGLGQVASQRGDSELAVERFSRVLELQPDATAVHYELALAYRQLGDLEAAREHLAQRGAGPPRFPDPLIDGLESLAVGARRHLHEAGGAFSRGDLEGAVAAYREAIAADPGNAEAHEALAAVLALQGKRSEALSHYLEALRLDPDDPRARHRTGQLLLRIGRVDEAVELLRGATELAPDFAAAFRDLALALERSGRLDEAVAAARRTVDLQPRDSEARLLLARLELLARLDPRRNPESELRGLLSRAPEQPMALLTLGVLLEGRQDLPGAVAAYRAVLELPRLDATGTALAARAHLLLARALERRTGRFEEAIEHLRAAARLAPDMADGHLDLAAALARRGDLEEALAAYRLALAVDPDDGDVRRGLADTLLRAGRCIEAREELERGVAKLPGDPGLRELYTRVAASCPDPASRGGKSRPR